MAYLQRYNKRHLSGAAAACRGECLGQVQQAAADITVCAQASYLAPAAAHCMMNVKKTQARHIHRTKQGSDAENAPVVQAERRRVVEAIGRLGGLFC